MAYSARIWALVIRIHGMCISLICRYRSRVVNGKTTMWGTSSYKGVKGRSHNVKENKNK